MTTCYDCDSRAYYCDYCYYEAAWAYEDYEVYVETEYDYLPDEVALADIFIMEGSDWEPAFPLEPNA